MAFRIKVRSLKYTKPCGMAEYTLKSKAYESPKTMQVPVYRQPACCDQAMQAKLALPNKTST